MPNELMKTLTIGANTYDLPQKTSDLTNDSGFINSAVLAVTLTESNDTYTADHTYAEIDAAISAGKTVIVDLDGYKLSLLMNDGGAYVFGITELIISLPQVKQRIAIVDNTNTWEIFSTSYTIVTTFNGRSGAITYTAPVTSVNGSTGAITGLQTADNLVTSVSSSSTNTQYPSAKCVYDAINNAIGTAIGGSY